ncbi:MAG: hypothetical protein F6K58_17350 [Symploca sp. SIO2E9]|nr:hypothetical protein [Symploca sp. SIO2E9]
MSGNSTHTPLLHEVAEHCLTILHDHGVPLPQDVAIDWQTFAQLSKQVHDNFQIPSTTFTPMMRRLVFAIAETAQPRNIVGAGTFVGYTFAWLIRERAEASHPPDCAIGIDVDSEANIIARTNCRILNHDNHLNFLDGDAVTWLKQLDIPIDLLYVDVDSPEQGRKMLYVDVLEASLPRLRSGALVLAHDASLPLFANSFAQYNAFVRNHPKLVGPWTLPVDECGLSVTAVL